MAEHRCGYCGAWFKGVPIDILVAVAQQHRDECDLAPNTPEEARRG